MTIPKDSLQTWSIQTKTWYEAQEYVAINQLIYIEEAITVDSLLCLVIILYFFKW